MAHIPHRIPRGFFLAMVGILFATLLAPVAAFADTDLVIGGQARIAYANGDDVRLRDEPAYVSNVLALIPEGTILEVLDGPFQATDASFWYYVGVNGQVGYMDATFLQLVGGEEAPPPVADVPVEDVPAPPAEEAAPPAPPVTAGAIGAVTGYGVIAGTNGDGVRCRADAGSGSATITVLPEGTEVELTGALFDVWQPVNCAGSGGFVHSAYVSYDGTAPAGDAGMNPEPESEPEPDQPAEDAPAPEEDSSFEASATVTGSATVAGTNGDGLRCRGGAGTDSSTITVLAEGTVVNLRGSAEGEWQPVLCADRNGWAHVSYLSYSGVPDDSDDGEADEAEGAEEATAQASGTARVTGTGGGGLNCRSSAQMGNNVITVLSEGSTVELRGGAQGSWQPVICAGRNGFASVDYLSNSSGGGDDGGDDGDDGGSSATGEGRITNAGGGLNCRSSAQMGNNVITVLPNGSRVDLRGSAQGEWQPVICAGRNGFVHVDYITTDGSSGGGGGDDDDGSSGGGGGSNSGLTAGMLAEVAGTNGDGLRLRSGASSGSSTITVMPEGTVVDVVSGSTGDWVAVSFNGLNGFAHMDYLTASDGSSSGGGGGGNDGGNSGGGGGGGGGWRLSTGDHAAATAALNLRYEPSGSAGVAAVAPSGTVVEITGAPSNGYYPVNWDGLSGYMFHSYLSWTDAPLSERGGSGNNGGGNNGGGNNNGGGATGNAMVNFAMQYLGYPYVWATAGPGSFDCSGFTYWVTLNVLGRDIGRGLWTQVAAGTPVSQGNLQPGDLVFFQNTYTWGLSHVGLYIGGGQFIHAENQNTGVRISDLGSQYYSSRWYGAVRLT
ncbi:MAG: SH3 domain-containing protein [Thermomicrobiales bacterium]